MRNEVVRALCVCVVVTVCSRVKTLLVVVAQAILWILQNTVEVWHSGHPGAGTFEPCMLAALNSGCCSVLGLAYASHWCTVHTYQVYNRANHLGANLARLFLQGMVHVVTYFGLLGAYGGLSTSCWLRGCCHRPKAHLPPLRCGIMRLHRDWLGTWYLTSTTSSRRSLLTSCFGVACHVRTCACSRCNRWYISSMTCKP
jgi:hypothetical protein